MNPSARRAQILEILEGSAQPVPANALSERLGVSRQIIVQDIAMLRTGGAEVTATNRGYVLSKGRRATRVFKCRHTMEEVSEECSLIIAAGGRVEDVFVNHRLYGKISARLDLHNRTHVEELSRSLASGASKPLMNVTDGFHYHTVSAENESALDGIEKELRERGFLVES